ncbi:MAG: FtsW/RodA/SpoVE family cell cycle protein [Desulfosporosinus sp.]|nr:FtsW/RodA/SpoVE family cell cycle protein [Desulfosporosinus sp.]
MIFWEVQVLQQSKITEYLEAVRQQIRWKRAQAPVLEEIRNHITDQKQAFIREGLNEETATERAIAEMGDPFVVGEQLDRAHRPRSDWPLLVMTAAMLLLGLVIQYLVGPNIPFGAESFGRQIVWAGIAILAMFAAYFMDFTILGKYSKGVFLVLCAITIASLFGEQVRGSSVAAIYPLLLFPTAFAGVVYSMRNKGYVGLALCVAAFMIPAYLSMRIPSVTVLFLLCISYLIILTVAVGKGWFNVRKPLAILMMYISTAIILSATFFTMRDYGYVMRRMQIVFNPLRDPTASGYLGSMAQLLLSHSQLIGPGLPIKGYGDYSVFRLLPDANTDYLLTHLVYRFGWIVFIGIVVLVSIFIMRAILLCKKQKSILGSLVSIAIISTFVIQCIVYIVINLGLLLLSPVSLPLISYGGRALVTNMFLIGLMLSVFRTGDLVRDKAGVEGTVVNSSSFIQYDNGQIIINLRNPFIK